MLSSVDINHRHTSLSPCQKDESMPDLSDFMISRVRVKLYHIFFANITEMYYVRELTRQTGEEINAVRRELTRMEKAGVIKKESRGNRLYYFANAQYDFFEDVLSLIAKTTGIGKSLRQSKLKLGKIKLAMLSGSYVRHQPRDENQVDLLIVGDVVMPELNLIIQQEEVERQLELNYTVMTAQEFQFRKNRRDPFVLQILTAPRIMIIGDQDSLLERDESLEN